MKKRNLAQGSQNKHDSAKKKCGKERGRNGGRTRKKENDKDWMRGNREEEISVAYDG